MAPNFKINIPEHCNENWNKMTPDETGRFCVVCNKSVIDFTSKLPHEIQRFFSKNQNRTICGRFKNSQLDTVSVKIPSILYPNTNYHKTFLLVLSLFMGNNMHSQSSLEGTLNPNISAHLSVTETNQIVDQPKACKATDSIVKIIDDSSIVMGPIESIYDRFLLSKSKNKKIEFESFSAQKEYEKTSNTEEKETETKPYFPQGMRSFFAFFASEFNPKNTQLEDMYISFTINGNGSLTYNEPNSYLDKNIQKEIIRVLKLSPKWIPAKSNGISIKGRYFFKVSIYNEVNIGN